MRPHLDYGDIIYDQPNNKILRQNIERIQYKVAVEITGAIKGTSQSKLYNELGFESLKFRRRFRISRIFFKLKTSGLPEYLFDLIPQNNHLYNCRKMLQHFTVELVLLSTRFLHLQY